MNSNVCILHHLGLGDQIMLNGMVRHFSEIYKNVYIVVKYCHEISVKFMYRDLINQFANRYWDFQHFIKEINI